MKMKGVISSDEVVILFYFLYGKYPLPSTCQQSVAILAHSFL